MDQFSTDDGEETLMPGNNADAPVTSISNHGQKLILNPIHASPSINSDDSEMIPMSKLKAIPHLDLFIIQI